MLDAPVVPAPLSVAAPSSTVPEAEVPGPLGPTVDVPAPWPSSIPLETGVAVACELHAAASPTKAVRTATRTPHPMRDDNTMRS
jgi:hypothetical protein